MTDTIFALSSGAPPAAIAVVRISGPDALNAVKSLTSKDFTARKATLSTLHYNGQTLDTALVLTFPGPASATGEDVAELHLHGGRATVAAVLEALAGIPNLRPAEPGEFTRRAFANGCLDLNQAEGLADLLAAETEAQRRAAMAMTGGTLTRMIAGWRQHVLDAAARIEAAIDYDGEDDVVPWPEREDDLTALAGQIEHALSAPPAERLSDGLRVVIAGPPNAGKSTLLNALAGREAAIVTPQAGTTRDIIEAPVRLGDVALLLTDTAGLHAASDDAIEIEGMRRAEAAIAAADIVLWLGEGGGPAGATRIAAKSDLGIQQTGLRLSAKTGEGLTELRDLLIAKAREGQREDGLTLNRRQRSALGEIASHLHAAAATEPLFAAEELRLARMALDRLQGRSGVEDMLDALFGRFCLGK
ncbi:tRNA modification GTPase MnmE [Sphingomonas antarctica]|uniref:tRNA uridine-5-carboxymethylaminomethyl(34) synthesis GTPase MnmE n=1 Tax=Sphingomonas antarctica TaxID=2040274 RepID=UPI0039EABB07